jgi:hypothetical protein
MDAGASEKEQFANAKASGSVDDVVLNSEVLDEKVARKIVVGLDAADLGCGKKDILRTFGIEEAVDLKLVGKVEFRGTAADEICAALTLEFPPDGATGEAVVTGDVNLGIGEHSLMFRAVFGGYKGVGQRHGWDPMRRGKPSPQTVYVVPKME